MSNFSAGLTLLALLSTLAWLPTLGLLTTLALLSTLGLLSTRPGGPWAFCPRPSGVSAAAIDITRLLLRLLLLRLSASLLRSRLLLPSLGGRLLPRLWAARLHIGALIARSYAVCAWPLPGLVAAALGALRLPLGPAIAAFRTLLLLTTMSFLRSLLPRITATFGARTLLGLVAVTIFGTLLLLLAPALTGGPLALIGVAIAILGTLPLVGVPVAILGAPALIGIPIAILRTLTLVGIPIAIPSALTVITVTAIGRTLLSSRGARRIITQAALLARAERTRRGYVPLRPDLGARLPNCHLRTEALTTAQVLLAHHDRAPNPGGAGQDARLNLIGPQRPADRSRNVGCRDPGVHGKARPSITDDDRAVDHHGLAEEDRILTFRHDHRSDTRRNEIARSYENPVSRRFAIVRDHLVRRQCGPANDIVVIAAPPLDPGRPPLLAGDPRPLHLVVVDPAAIVVGHPAPARFGISLDPV